MEGLITRNSRKIKLDTMAFVQNVRYKNIVYFLPNIKNSQKTSGMIFTGVFKKHLEGFEKN
ncbi:hypothetical protein M667_16695 [Cellulophaga baltica NN016038]|nr:hypothetical protein M667_16695 [Cellulophaga baltica NN016038]